VADVWKRKGRKSKPWVADYLDANGKRHRIAAASKEEAQALLVEKTKENRERGPSIGDPNITVKGYSEIWFRRSEADWKHSTRHAYRYALNTHIIPDLGGYKLRDLSRPHVKWFVDSKRQAGLSKATIDIFRSVLSGMLGEALEDGMVARNVALATGRRKRKATTRGRNDPGASIRPLNESEVAALLEAAPRGDDSRTLFMLLARAGLRPGEAFALQWADFDFTARQILVERSLYKDHIDSPKSGRSRLVDMSQQLAAALSSLQIEREREKLAGRWSDIPAWVFCRKAGEHAGEPLVNETVRYQFARAMRRAGISGHTLYDLRHTFASTLLAKGAPITYVAAQMGHSNPNVTLKHYAHWIPSTGRPFVDSLDTEFGTTYWHHSEKRPAFSRENAPIAPKEPLHQMLGGGTDYHRRGAGHMLNAGRHIWSFAYDGSQFAVTSRTHFTDNNRTRMNPDSRLQRN
jgi:integrase